MKTKVSVAGSGNAAFWMEPVLTSQPVDCPLFELLEGDICSGRHRVEVEPVGVRRLLCARVGKLAFSVVDMASFRVNSIVVLSEHLVAFVKMKCGTSCGVCEEEEEYLNWGRDWQPRRDEAN